jgi:hypothetical protein
MTFLSRLLLVVAAAVSCGAGAALAAPIVWVVPSSLQRVGPTDPAGAGLGAVVRAGRGEAEPFQVAIQAPAGGLTHVDFSVSDLVGPGGQTIPRSALTLYRENYVKIRRHSPTYLGPPNLPLTANVFPDGLIPFLDPTTGLPPNPGRGRVAQRYKAVPLDLAAGQNAVIWIDVAVPRSAAAGTYAGSYTVSSDQGSIEGQIELDVWDFTLPIAPSLKSSFNSYNRGRPGVGEELLRHKLMPDAVPVAEERGLIDQSGLNTADLLFYGGASYGHCKMTPAPSVADLLAAKATHQPDLFLYDFSADEIDLCSEIFPTVQAWARNLHQAGIPNLVTMAPVPELLDDGSGTGRSAVDVWVMLPSTYDQAQAQTPPRVTQVLAKGDAAWSYNALVQDSYSPKWELDFAPINYRIQPGFINQSLGLTGLLYWTAEYWSGNPWTNAERYRGYPGEGLLVYPGKKIGIAGVAPSMRLKYLRDGVDDYEYIELLKRCGQGDAALAAARTVGADWSHWTTDETQLESVRRQLGDLLQATHCAP